MAEYVFEPCLADDKEVVAAASYAVGSELELCGAFFTRYIEYAAVAYRKQILQHKGRFAYAWFAANQHNRASHKTSSQHAVELFAGHVESWLVHSLNLIYRPGNAFGADGRSRRFCPRGSCAYFFLHHCVPRSASRAFAGPFGGVGSAFGAEPHGLLSYFCHQRRRKL